jgi:periplasmic copper chaperone A
MNARTIITGLLLLGGASAAVASTPACTPVIEKAWIRAAPPGATALAGYAIVRNACTVPLAITGVSSGEFVMGMIHETVVLDGLSQMRHVKSLPVPARGELRFAPGGRHLMLMHPKRQLNPGDKVKVSLELVDGRQISAYFVVSKDAVP